MFRKIMHWVRVDPEGLGRPRLAGNEDIQSLAVPICVLSLIHELEDAKILCDDLNEAR
jgi:N-acylglucosamine 2-epimerase